MTKLNEIAGDHVLQASVAGQATAGTADEFTVGRLPVKATITAVYFVPKTVVTGAATNNFTATLRNRGQAGAGTAQPAQLNFANTVNAPALQATALPLSSTAADLDCAAGDVLTCEKLVVGTGLAMPAGTIVVHYKVR